MGRVDLAIGGLPVRSRFNSLGDQSDSKNMGAHSSNFNASNGGRGRGWGRGGNRSHGHRGTTNNKMRCTTDEDLESKLGFDLFRFINGFVKPLSLYILRLQTWKIAFNECQLNSRK